MITAVMPTYGRKDVVFERGEGNYLYAADGRRYCDFTSGIAVNALGHCHPALVKALTEQGAKLWHTSNLYRMGNGERLAKRLDREFVRRHDVLLQLGRRGDRGRHQADPQVSIHERPAQALQDHLLPGGVPWPLAERARRHRQREIPRRLRPAGARLQARAAQQHQRRARHGRRRDRRHPGRADPGRRRRPRQTTAQFLKDLRAICDEFGLLLFYDEIHTGFRPYRQAVGLRLVGRGARRDGRSPRAWAAASRSAPSWRPRRRRSAWCRARTARPMAAIRWPRAWPTRVLDVLLEARLHHRAR